MKTKIIYEDPHILICYKPAGLATQTAKVGQQDMVSELKNYLAAAQRAAGKKAFKPYLGVVHRLDQPVEGLLVFAKEPKSAAKLTAALSAGTLNKQYYAVVCGKPDKKEAELVDYLAKDDATGSAVVVPQAGGESVGDERAAGRGGLKGQKAVLQYRVLEQREEDQLALLDIHIDTGRFHQIRAQMSHAGYPLVGDSRYGSEASVERSRRLGVRNVALCAYLITLKHPVTGKKMEFRIRPEGKIFGYF